MDRQVTFGRLLTILLLLAIPFSYWSLTMTIRVNTLEKESKVITQEVLQGIDTITETLNKMEKRTFKNDSLNKHSH